MNYPGLTKTYPLGVFRDGGYTALLGREKYGQTFRLVYGRREHANFKLQTTSPALVLPLGRQEHLPDIAHAHVSHILGERLLTYTHQSDDHQQVRVARYDSEGGLGVWEVSPADRRLSGRGAIVPEYRFEGQTVMYFGTHNLRVAFSKQLPTWHINDEPLVSTRPHHFDHSEILPLPAAHVTAGLFVPYEARERSGKKLQVHIGAVLCDAADPTKVLWRSNDPLYSHEFSAGDEPRVLGVLAFERHLELFFATKTAKFFTVEIPNPFGSQSRAPLDLSLHRSPRNPILSPRIFEWESQAVFNPAAFTDNGRVHLLYRAMGSDGISRIGYASSADGINFDERLEYPVYTPSHGFGLPETTERPADARYNPELFPSGGGWAGCEDPRAITVDGRVYMSFVAFNGWDFMRQALTSLDLEDFRAKRWSWQNPVLISKPGETHKNWVIFPEKINGKYAILHGLSPKIHIEYIDSLENFDGQTFIDSLPPAGGHGYHDPRRGQHWDKRVRGAGAPPLKTDLGWLLLYHATDQRDPGKYKLGAMLLDLDDPTKVLMRANAPILQPDEWYENDGKPGVVYTCGAVIVGENLVVYYGGGDKHIAVARANVKRFLDALATNHAITLTPVALSEIGVV